MENLLQKKKSYQRSDRLSELLKREISNILQFKLKDPVSGFLTVSGVKLSGDMKIAYIYVSILGKQSDREKTMQLLNDSKKLILSNISKNVRLKYLPTLKFFFDDGYEYSDKISEVISRVKTIEDMQTQKRSVEFTETDLAKLKALNEKIISADKILITSHSKGDGDSIGCVLSMYNYLTTTFSEKKVSIAIDGGCPKYLGWLPDTGIIESDENIFIDKNFDLVVCLDSNFEPRVGFPFRLFKNYIEEDKVVVIDHHQDTPRSKDLYFANPISSSTGELIYQFFKTNDIQINDKIAIYLYVAIVTDTWQFSQENTTTGALKIASELLEFDTVKPNVIAAKLFENKSFNQLKLLALMLETLELHNNEKIASAYISKEMFDKTNTTIEDTEGFVNFVRAPQSVQVAILFKEQSTGKLRVNLRSKDKFNLLPFVKHYNGGGHIKAAGFDSNKPLKQLLPEAIELLSKMMNNE